MQVYLHPELWKYSLGYTANGSACGQWSLTDSANQRWIKEAVGNYYKLKNRATGLYLDGMGSAGNGADLCQYASLGSTNQ